ncbi:Na+/H+ antiporter NhaC [Lewinella marina]|uniref:Sodium:proton antiporter n=1 Tax=Neolewinella marina TaxID=438751 RepID=A0A2G0CJW9_9BACT|nr:Na+/H+ antiporter NhaC family protein [Neolewinella marina]NJB84582.1 Na+/H+ antiporter NhaC [Neolewinella marina]PHL00238.1 sodium:proton antiporter [Neolewinella marina]
MPAPTRLILLLLFSLFTASGLDAQYRVSAREGGLFVEGADAGATFTVNGDTVAASPAGSGLLLSVEPGIQLVHSGEQTELYHLSPAEGPDQLRRIPLWLSILPPLIAIGLALIFKEVIISLFAGIWVGAFIAGGLRFEFFLGVIKSLLATIDTYIIESLNDSGHLSVLVFSLMIGGMVAVISRNGGMAGVVHRMSKYATNPRRGQFVTWLLGVAIFFDDYANTLIVGNTMRSVTDKFRISREKLAYIVDSTAAPVASVAFITTWIGAELGYIGDGIEQVPHFADSTPYAVFIESLKYSFYPILTLAFILYLIYQRRDFGPMLTAETRARTTGVVKARGAEESAGGEQEDLDPIPGAPLRARNAAIPVLTVIVMTIIGLLDTGLGSLQQGLANPPATGDWGAVWGALEGGFFVNLGLVIGAADSYVALLWASMSGVIVAMVLTIGQKIMNVEETIGSLTAGFKAMFSAVMILTLAWALALTTEQLHTATFLVELLGDALNPYFLQPVIFVLAALISFSTGSSWSTMAILYPIAIPLTWTVAMMSGWEEAAAAGLFYNVISTVLAASVLGDHCSPISDTTILSSLASDCNHIDHVRTQLPYALTVGAVALLCGFLSTVLGGGWLVCLSLMAAGLIVLWFVVRTFGQTMEMDL